MRGLFRQDNKLVMVCREDGAGQAIRQLDRKAVSQRNTAEVSLLDSSCLPNSGGKIGVLDNAELL